jgi:hypothetical protein
VRNVPVTGLETGQRYGTNVVVPHPGQPLRRVPHPCSGLTGEFRTFASASWYHGVPHPVPHPLPFRTLAPICPSSACT